MYIFPEIARELVRRITGYSGQELTATALYRQLKARDYIITEDDGHNTPHRNVGGKSVRVLVFKENILLDKVKNDEVNLDEARQVELNEIAQKERDKKIQDRIKSASSV